MNIGYPCLNYAVEGANATFRLASYSPDRFRQAVRNNAAYLERLLAFNGSHGLGFFRISSDIIPFASHPVQTVDWLKEFKEDWQRIGRRIAAAGMRISMHPDQFVLINSPREDVVRGSMADLQWHAGLLDAMGLDASAKIQIHVGGVYGDRSAAIRRFIANYLLLPGHIRRRLVIENDDRSFPLADCMAIFEAVGVPILFDYFHHECLHHGEAMPAALKMAAATWAEKDGVMMVDYSSQQPGAVRGKHADAIDPVHFRRFLMDAEGVSCDVMLEIKDKQRSALIAKEMCHAGV